jgi:hypothetical protein
MAITSRALVFASRWFDEATVRRTFEPLIADWQREWHDAPASRRRWISLRGLGAFALAVILSSPRIARTSAPSNVTNRIATRMVGVMAILTTLLMIPPVVQLWLLWTAGSSWIRGAVFLFTLPPALALAFPLAVVGGVDAIRRHRSLPGHVARAAALKLGVLAAIFMLVYGGWVIPAASEASRHVMNPQGMTAPLRGMQELTTSELVLDPARATVFAPGTDLASRSASLQRELNKRAAMIALPIVLLWLRWRAYHRPRDRWFTPLPAWLAIPIAILALSAATTSGAWLEREWQLWAGTRSWIPIAMFAMWGMLSSYGRRLLPART